jgi:hypothetical protein
MYRRSWLETIEFYCARIIPVALVISLAFPGWWDLGRFYYSTAVSVATSPLWKVFWIFLFAGAFLVLLVTSFACSDRGYHTPISRFMFWWSLVFIIYPILARNPWLGPKVAMSLEKWGITLLALALVLPANSIVRHVVWVRAGVRRNTPAPQPAEDSVGPMCVLCGEQTVKAGRHWLCPNGHLDIPIPPV